ncbi:Mitochondrial distribution and morphology protein 31, mitochondrial precursor [Thecaphora frezii]
MPLPASSRSIVWEAVTQGARRTRLPRPGLSRPIRALLSTTSPSHNVPRGGFYLAPGGSISPLPSSTEARWRQAWGRQSAASAERQRYAAIRTFFNGMAQSRGLYHGPPLHLAPGWQSSVGVGVLPWHTRRNFGSSTLHRDEGKDIRARSGTDHEKDDGDKMAYTPSDTTPAKAIDACSMPQPDSPETSLTSTSPEKPRAALASHSEPTQEASTAVSAYKHFQNYPRSLRELALRAIPQTTGGQNQKDGPEAHAAQGTYPSTWIRPQKEDLLRIAHGFWTRMRIRFKWFTIRGFRRFNADDISAFFTLGGMGTIIFIIVGTTTFFSLIFAALNALNLQGWIARKIADYLTAETGVTVVFESAIVPKWKDRRISFKNVFISRRAHTDAEALRRERQVKMHDEALRDGKRGYRRVKRRTGITAGDGMSWEGTHYDEEEEVAPPMSDEARGEDLVENDLVDVNFSMFDLQVDCIDVTLSLSRWFDGKGLIEDAEIKGVRGIVDRRNVFWDPQKPYDPKAARKQPRHGDFELESLVVEDFLVTIYQPNDFRPFNFSIFNARIPKLRKQWLFYDLLCAESIMGQIDGCLFSLHKPQSIGRTVEKDREMSSNKWKSMSRLRIDGVNFDHIQNQSELTGPVSWILSGKFDVVADIKFPRDFNEDMDMNTIIAEILDNISAAVSGEAFNHEDEDRPIPGQHRLSGPAIEAPVTTVGATADRMRKESEEARRHGKPSRAAADAPSKRTNGEPIDGHTSTERPKLLLPPPSVVIDMDVRFKDIKAAVPLFTNDISYRTNAFVRPIVAFMNANKTLIPVHCRIVVDLSEFDGSLDLAQTGLLPVVSDKIYEALANHVASENANNKRLRNVSIWSLQVTANAALRLVTLLRDTLVRSTATSTLAPVPA